MARRGHACVHVQRGPEAEVDAPLAFLHVDLTRVPRPYLEGMRPYPRVINGAVETSRSAASAVTSCDAATGTGVR